LRNFSNIELREWQKKLKEKIKSAINTNKLVFLNSPTGSGKTLFSLLVGLETKGKVLFLVRTHNEYNPVFRDFLKINTDKALKFSFLMGKPTACLFSEGDVSTDDINCNLCSFKTSIIDLEVEKYPNEFVKELKKQGIEKGFCPYFSLFNDIGKADVIVLTYPYFFIDRFRESLGIEFEDYLIVVDEAHNVEKIGDFEERTLSSHLLDMAIKQAKNEFVKFILQRVKDELVRIASNVESYIRANEIPEISEDEIEVLKEEYEELREQMIKERKIKRIYLGSVIKFYESYKDGEGLVPFIHKNKIVLKSIDISNFLQILNDNDLTFLLMSGTLPPEDYIKKIWNITRSLIYINVEREIKEKVSGDYECILAIDVTSKYDSRGDIMWKKYGDYLLKVYYQAKAHVLSVFPSYEIMNRVMEFIQVPKYLEDEDSEIETLYSFVKKFNKVIIGAVGRGKLTEGVELVKDGRSLISDVVIVGIPYPPPDDYTKLVAQKISERLGRKSDEYLYKIPALMTVRQSIGRGIRGINDHVKVWLLDRRFDSLWWKKNLNCFNPKKTRL
jgi:DNA excision repair protein ERCC-2